MTFDLCFVMICFFLIEKKWFISVLSFKLSSEYFSFLVICPDSSYSALLLQG